ncbi:MAG: DUF4256 domain-containing protein [Eubacteriales bacterium]|nr:DUF4256 domain-containing protein [Eubacteriales bacterium]
MKQADKSLLVDQSAELLAVLQDRFEKNPHRHPILTWSDIEARLAAAPGKLWALSEMERTGGEPDVIGYDPATSEFLIADCSAETPKGRRSLCYDQAALAARKENKPQGSACGMAEAMGIEILDEERYRDLQKLGVFDVKTSSWLKTPEPMRKLGGALFGDSRYDRVFVYHNGAESYYAARGFRGLLRV